MSAGKHRFLIGCLSLDGRDVQKKGNTSVCCAVHKGLKIYFIFLFLRGAIRISLLLQCNRSKSGPLFFVVKVCIITYIVSYSCTWCSFCGHFASQEPCWHLHHQRLLPPTKSRCPRIGPLAHPATAMCPHSGEEWEAWVWWCSICRLHLSLIWVVNNVFFISTF